MTRQSLSGRFRVGEARPVHEVCEEGRDADAVKAFNDHVAWGATCVPVFCDDDYDTNLAFTYCHRLLDDDLREPMVLRFMLVGDGLSRRYRTVLPYSHSEIVSVKNLLGGQTFKGACFAWSERESDGAGFTKDHRRLAVAFFAYYLRGESGQRIDCSHASPGHSNYYRQRPFLVAELGNKVTGIVCAPTDAYHHRPSQLTYTFSLQAGNAELEKRRVSVPFTPTLWVDLGELFGVEFDPKIAYTYAVEGPKGKGWIMIETRGDFNLHHL